MCALQVALALFEAWAGMGAMPMKTATFGRLVREHIKAGAFTPQVRAAGALCSCPKPAALARLDACVNALRIAFHAAGRQ